MIFGPNGHRESDTESAEKYAILNLKLLKQSNLKLLKLAYQSNNSKDNCGGGIFSS